MHLGVAVGHRPNYPVTSDWRTSCPLTRPRADMLFAPTYLGFQPEHSCCRIVPTRVVVPDVSD
jgi:hypothetical protein